MDPTENDEYLLSQYLDGALTQDEERALRERLELDAGLARCLNDYRRVDGWVGEWSTDAPEVDWARFESEFQRRRALADRPGRRSLVFKLFAPLAAAAALFVAFTAIQSTRQSPTMFVEISRAMSVSAGPTEAYVTYGPRKDDARRAVLSSGSDVIIAFASVGGRVD